VLVIHPAHCINKEILCQRSKDDDQNISKEVLNSLDGQLKTYANIYFSFFPVTEN
jgi:hypothetical protein